LTGYQRLLIFVVEKRMWEEEGEEDGMENYHRRRHD
jgi:hypothetical protein